MNGRGLDLWYHFAIMFEALFILTTLDAGTRVGRYMIQDFLGSVWKPFGDTKNLAANVAASLLMVAGWGWFLIQGVNDEYGGIKSLWPLFGIANQLLASIALCLATTIVLKMQRLQSFKFPNPRSHKTGKPIFALVVFVPLVWLLAVTMTAGWQKIFHEDARIGFLSAAQMLDGKMADLQKSLNQAHKIKDAVAIATIEKAMSDNRKMHFNDEMDAVVAGFFMLLVLTIAAISLYEWTRLIVWRQAVKLCESESVLLPEYAVAESRPVNVLGMVAFGCALAKELSSEAHLERAERAALTCQCANVKVDLLGARKDDCAKSREQLYMEVTERRFEGPNRCC